MGYVSLPGTCGAFDNGGDESLGALYDMTLPNPVAGVWILYVSAEVESDVVGAGFANAYYLVGHGPTTFTYTFRN